VKVELFHVDAFTTELFKGNPAAVCKLERWISDGLLLEIAAENNLPETAFIVGNGDRYEIRWFTPLTEVDLCGHATLASGYVLSRHFHPEIKVFKFESKTGQLSVECMEEQLVLDFPAIPCHPIELTPCIEEALGVKPIETLLAAAHIAILPNEELIYAARPDLDLISQLDSYGLIVSAAATSYDFVSRCFFPKLGIPEDPVTGAAHCALAPYWAEKLGRRVLNCRQVSRRGGNLRCEVIGDRVLIAGNCVLYTRSKFEL
jgi:PhzF family phenazine biosynthesis protein